MRKVYCVECKHCAWPSHNAETYGRFSKCDKVKDPDKTVDDPVIGLRVQEGERTYCSIINSDQKCEAWEQADEETISARTSRTTLMSKDEPKRRLPESRPSEDAGCGPFLIFIVAIIIIAGIVGHAFTIHA